MKEILDYKVAKEMATKNVGLTYKEIEKAENGIYFKYYQGNCRMSKYLVKKDKKTLNELEKDEQVLSELRFRNWCNSCLTYGCTWHFEKEELSGSTLDLYELTLDRALEIIEQQKERFKDAKVLHDVYTDSDGCTYNSVIWD